MAEGVVAVAAQPERFEPLMEPQRGSATGSGSVPASGGREGEPTGYGGLQLVCARQLAEVEILEAPGPDSVVAGLPIDLALPAFGGTVLRFSSERYGGEAVRLLQKRPDGRVDQGKTTEVRVTKDGPQIGVQVLRPE